jgi:hypothetical protein
MTLKQLKERHGIELIGKEMWVWDDDIELAKLDLVLHKRIEQGSLYYKCYYKCFFKYYKNASDTNPNEPKQPKVGDMGYFWDDEESYLCSVLKNIVHDGRPAYYCSLGLWFANFSRQKQSWMK